MPKSIIVHGPQGCGKTSNAEALRQHYGMTHVLDGWGSRDRLPLRDTLILTSESPEALGLNELSIECVSYEDAVAAAGNDPHVPGDATDMAEALAAISQELGCANTLDDMLRAIDALRRAPALPQFEWSTTLCEGKRVNHAAAEKACAALGVGWRLPTRVELLSLVDDTRSDPAIDTERFPDTKSGAYWTSTPFASDSSYAWLVNFNSGNAYLYLRVNHLAFVRAVRASSAGQ